MCSPFVLYHTKCRQTDRKVRRFVVLKRGMTIFVHRRLSTFKLIPPRYALPLSFFLVTDKYRYPDANADSKSDSDKYSYCDTIANQHTRSDSHLVANVDSTPDSDVETDYHAGTDTDIHIHSGARARLVAERRTDADSDAIWRFLLGRWWRLTGRRPGTHRARGHSAYRWAPTEIGYHQIDKDTGQTRRGTCRTKRPSI